MANASSRTLQLLSLLQTIATGPAWNWPTGSRCPSAPCAATSTVTAARGTDGGSQLAPGAVLPPLLLDDEEAVALAVGIGDAAQSGIAGMEEASLRALTKVVRVLPARLRARVDVLRAMTVSGNASGPIVAAGVPVRQRRGPEEDVRPAGSTMRRLRQDRILHGARKRGPAAADTAVWA